MHLLLWEHLCLNLHDLRRERVVVIAVVDRVGTVKIDLKDVRGELFDIVANTKPPAFLRLPVEHVYARAGIVPVSRGIALFNSQSSLLSSVAASRSCASNSHSNSLYGIACDIAQPKRFDASMHIIKDWGSSRRYSAPMYMLFGRP